MSDNSTGGEERCVECGGPVSTANSIFGTNWKCDDCGDVKAYPPSRIRDRGGGIHPVQRTGCYREPLFDAEDRETFDQAIEQWGWQPQVDMATEECGELIVALSRFMRGRNDEEDVVDELADVRIMCEQLTEFIGRETVENHVQVKMDRLRERIQEDDA